MHIYFLQIPTYLIQLNIFCVINLRACIDKSNGIIESLRMMYPCRGTRWLSKKKPFTYSSRVCERRVTNSDRVLLVKSALCRPERGNRLSARSLRFISRMRDCLKLRSVQFMYDLQELLKNFRIAY